MHVMQGAIEKIDSAQEDLRSSMAKKFRAFDNFATTLHKFDKSYIKEDVIECTVDKSLSSCGLMILPSDHAPSRLVSLVLSLAFNNSVLMKMCLLNKAFEAIVYSEHV